jgi:hypothetical protein
MPTTGHALGRAWTATYDGGSQDWAGCPRCSSHNPLPFVEDDFIRSRNSVATDTSGNVYVTGTSWNGANYDFRTIKYDANGVRQWVATHDGGDEDQAYAVAVDGGGNVYVTGWSVLDTPDYSLQPHFQTIKYSAAGVRQWTAAYNEGVWGQGFAMKVDASGNVYVTGEAYNGDFIAMALLKYSPAGALQWSRRILYGFEYEESSPNDMTLDAAGNIYVAGYSFRPGAADGRDYLAAKYSPAGAEIWTRVFNIAGMRDQAVAIVADESGNAYVAGTSQPGGPSWMLKYSATGVVQWNAQVHGIPHALLAANGGIYIAGASGDELILSFYKANGPAAGGWFNFYQRPGGTAHAYALAMAGGDLFLAGTSTDASGTDVQIAAFDGSSGELFWADRFDGGYDDYAYAIAGAADGSFSIAGFSGNGTDDDLLAIRYTQPPGTSLHRLTLSPSVVIGGCGAFTATVTINGPAPAGGAVVLLTTNNPYASLPASVTIPEGETSRTFTIPTAAVTSAWGGFVSATYGGLTRHQNITIRPPRVASLVLSPNPVVGPGRVSASVLLECAAAAGNIVVSLGTSNAAVARPDVSSITIPAGAVSGRFTVSTADVSTTSWADIRASANGPGKQVRLEVKP